MKLNNFDRELQKNIGIPYPYRGNFPMPIPSAFVEEVKRGPQRSRVITRSVEEQKNLLNRWCTDVFEEPLLIGMGTDHLDTRAMRAATLITRFQYQFFQTGVQCWNCAGYEKLITPLGEAEQLLFLYNIHPGMTRVRLQTLRDVLSSRHEAVIIMVVAGCNALSFANDYLRYPLSYAIHFSDI